jgi:hypothetical protein
MLSPTPFYSLFFYRPHSRFNSSCRIGKCPCAPGIVGLRDLPGAISSLDRKRQDLFPQKPQIFSPRISVSELFMTGRSGLAPVPASRGRFLHTKVWRVVGTCARFGDYIFRRAGRNLLLSWQPIRRSFSQDGQVGVPTAGSR